MNFPVLPPSRGSNMSKPFFRLLLNNERSTEYIHYCTLCLPLYYDRFAYISTALNNFLTITYLSTIKLQTTLYINNPSLQQFRPVTPPVFCFEAFTICIIFTTRFNNSLLFNNQFFCFLYPGNIIKLRKLNYWYRDKSINIFQVFINRNTFYLHYLLCSKTQLTNQSIDNSIKPKPTNHQSVF